MNIDYANHSFWIKVEECLPENGTHCFIRNRKQNKPCQWQWNYCIAEYMVPKVKNQVPVFRVYDMVIRLEDISHWMQIPEI